jgi:hypothetical protein
MKHFGNWLLKKEIRVIFLKSLSIRIISSWLLISSICIISTSCSSKDGPSDDFAINAVLGESIKYSPEVVFSRKINLDELPDFEFLILIRNGSDEILSTFKLKNNGEWTCVWKKSFSLMNAGPFEYNSKDKKWIPSKANFSNDGFIIKNVLAVELAGDHYNSIFFEIMSEEPPMGLFSVPMGYRKGSKILDGLQLFKDHPKVKNVKRVDFSYKKEDKSIIVFPKDKNSSLEFVFNGYEMVLNLNSQPIPSLVDVKRDGNKFRLEFKNRGGYTSVTYLTLSFPEASKIKVISETGVRGYQKGDSIYPHAEGRQITAKFPLVEATKEGWGANVRYAFEFELTMESKKNNSNSLNINSNGSSSIDSLSTNGSLGQDKNQSASSSNNIEGLYRISYKWNRNTETIPNSFSVAPYTMDQQGFPAYNLTLP